MQINKVNASPNFGAKLNLTGATKKHWNMSDKEIKALYTKAEEIGSAKDTVTFNIGKYGEFRNSKMLEEGEFRNNVEGPVAGCFRKVTVDLNLDGENKKYKLSEFSEGHSPLLEEPYHIMKRYLNRLANNFPNKIHEQRKEQNIEKFRTLITDYDSNVQKFTDFLFNGDDAKKVTEHIEHIKDLDEICTDSMVNLDKLNKEETKKFERMLSFAPYFHPLIYMKEMLTRACVRAPQFLKVRSNPAEYAKLQEKENMLLKMSERG